MLLNLGPSIINSPRASDKAPFEAFSLLDRQKARSHTNSATPESQNQADTARGRGSSNTSTLQSRIRSASKKFEESKPPAGFRLASAQIGSSIPTTSGLRRGSYGSEGWSVEGQVIENELRTSWVRRRSSQTSGHFLQGTDSPTAATSPTSVRSTGGEHRHESSREATDNYISLDVIKQTFQTQRSIILLLALRIPVAR